jgi:hypothetical protein
MLCSTWTLGKVFENLIKENLRKGLGSYYTPREIVHYMCQECLIGYLETSNATMTVRGLMTALAPSIRAAFSAVNWRISWRDRSSVIIVTRSLRGEFFSLKNATSVVIGQKDGAKGLLAQV